MKTEESNLEAQSEQLDIPVVIRSFSIEDLRKAYEIGRTDARISEREGKYYDTFDEWFSQNCV